MAKFTLQLITLNYRETILSTDLIQYNSLLTLPWWGFSVTMRLKKKQKKKNN